MSRKKLAIAAVTIAVTCLSAAVYAQESDSSGNTLSSKLESLRRGFLNPRGNTATTSRSNRQSYTERHRQRINGSTTPSPTAPQQTAVPASTNAGGNAPIYDQTKHGLVERLREEPSKEVAAAEAAAARVPAAPVVSQGNSEVPFHGIPRRVKRTAPVDSTRNASIATEVPAFGVPTRRPATVVRPETSDLNTAIATQQPSDDLLQQRQDLRTARRVIPQRIFDSVPVVEAAVEPQLEDSPIAQELPAEAPSVVATEEPAAAVATAQPAASDELLFANKSPILNVQTLGPRATVIGRESVYKVRVQNLGGVAADGVTVKVEIPTWAEITQLQPTRGSTRTATINANESVVQWQVGKIDAQSNELLTLKLIPRKSKSFDLAVNWTFTPVKTETLIEVQEPKLKLSLTGPNDVLFGETKIYHLTVSNPGSGAAENVVVQLLPIDGNSTVAASQNLGTLTAGETRALEVELTARQAGAVSMRANVVADNGLRDEVVEQILVRRADLKIEVIGPSTKFAGTPGRYRVRVTNPGNASAEQVTVHAILPSGAKYMAASNGGRLDEQTRRVEWSINSLRPAEERILEMQCLLNSPGANSFRVTTDATGELADSASTITQVEALADLKLEVIDPKGPVPTGKDATYELRIKNRGTKSAQNIEIVAFFSEGIEPINVTGGPGEIGAGQVAFSPVNSLPAGGELVLKIVARAEGGGNHVFRAEVSCPDLGTRLAAQETTLYYDSVEGAAIRTSVPAAAAIAVPLPVETSVEGAEVEPEMLEPAEVIEAELEPATSESPQPVSAAAGLGDRYAP